ncbi:MAG: dicarboxylate/amino acid:cation symporter [Holosporales bacterium]|jgi:proton glutamate symport protein|nr:dicarboxylate/amino acid:cation symporter [Holosporales bacterium]
MKISVSTTIKHPLFLLICIIGGIYIGFSHKQLAPILAPFSTFYTNLLQITVIPIISLTILTSVTKLLSHNLSNTYIMKILMTFLSMVFFTGIFAVTSGYILHPGKNMSSDPNIVKIVEDSGGGKTREITIDEPIEKVQSVSIVEFLVNTVPNNIFRALSSANMLQIIVFCVILSISCGLVSRNDKKQRMQFVGDYLPIFYKINEKVLFFLPFGSFCLLSTQLSNTSESTLFTIFSLALVMLSVILSLTILCSIILWRCSGRGYGTTLKSLFETLIMAFSTQSSVICIPKAVNAMTEKLGFDKQIVELTIPLGIPLCQFSTICFYAIGTIFVTNIFNESLNFSGYSFIVLASILTSLAASGVKGVIYYSLMAGILAPLGIPLGNTIALFIAVDPLIDPFGTVFHVLATCCSSALCCKLSKNNTDNLETTQKICDESDGASGKYRRKRKSSLTESTQNHT